MRIYYLSQFFSTGLLALSISVTAIAGEAPTEDHRSDLAEMLIKSRAPSTSQSPSVVEAFSRGVPERFFVDNDAWLYSESEKTFQGLLGFLTVREIEWTEESEEPQWLWYIGGNEGFCAIVKGVDRGAEIVWSADSIASLSSPSIEFVELTGSPPREIIVRGYPGLSSDQAGEIIHWDGWVGKRLTANTQGFQAYYWEYVDLDSLGTKGILLHDTEFRDRKGAQWEQLLKYDPDSNAIIAEPKTVVGNRK